MAEGEDVFASVSDPISIIGDDRNGRGANVAEELNYRRYYRRDVGENGDAGGDDEDDDDEEDDSPDYPVYGTTPPVSKREMKKMSLKSKHVPRVPKVNVKIVQESKKLRKNSGKDENLPSQEYVKIQVTESVSEDNKNSLEYKRGKRLSRVERNQQRDIKHSEAMFVETDAHAGGPSNRTVGLIASPIQKLDSPNHFKTLNYLPVSPQHTPEKVLAKRQISSPKIEECPADRMAFYKTFSLLITIGSQKKTDPQDEKFAMTRQQSQQNMLQARWPEVLWLALQAWQASRTMEEQDLYLWDRRQQVLDVLNMVLNFQVPTSPVKPKPIAGTITSASSSSASTPNSSSTNTASLPHSNIDSDSGGVSPPVLEQSDPSDEQVNTVNNDSDITESSVGSSNSKRQSLTLDFNEAGTTKGKSVNEESEQSQPSPSRSFTPFSLISSDDIAQQREALLHVTCLMNKLEAVENLYPNLKALKREYPDYASEKFQGRIETLCLWLNITKDMSQKLKLMAKTLGVDEIDHLNWPGLDNESPKFLPPDSDDGEREGEVVFGIETPKRGSLAPLEEDSFEVAPSDFSTPLKRRGFSSSSYNRSSLPSIGDVGFGTWIYRPFVDKSLKQMGLRKMIERLRDLLDGTLQRAKQALQRPSDTFDVDRAMQTHSDRSKRSRHQSTSSSYMSPDEDGFRHGYHHALSMLEEHMASMERRNSLTSRGTSCQDFISMGLPSFRPTYLFLVRITLDVMHECLRLRLEHKPKAEPSLLSIKQLISECKEVITGSILIKQYYHRMVCGVLWDARQLQEKFENDLDEYEKDLKDMLHVYFDYLHSWIQMLQRLPNASLSLKNIIQEEWSFAKEMCPHIRGGEAQAGQRFCVMATGLLTSTSEFLAHKMDELCSNLQDSTSFSETLKTTILESCRGFKELFHETRERASKALGFAKLLRKDLEIAAEFAPAVPVNELLTTLRDSGHVRVLASHSSDYLLFIPQFLKDNQIQILQLLDVTCGNEDVSDQGQDNTDGYLLLIKADSSVDGLSPVWDGDTVRVHPTVETTIALADVEVDGLLLVVNHSSQLQEQRKAFSRAMKDKVSLNNEQTSSHPGIAEALEELKSDALSLCETIRTTVQQVEENLDLDSMTDIEEIEKISRRQYCKETMHQCFNVGFEYHKEVSRLVTGEARQKLGDGMLNFAQKWMNFVLEKCERGRGTRPRWASQGLDFLILAIEPRNLTQLSEEDFQELKNMMNTSISHLIGTQEKSPASPAGYRSASPAEFTGSPRHISRPLSWPSSLSTVNRSLSTVSANSEPPLKGTPGQQTSLELVKRTDSTEENQHTLSVPSFKANYQEFRSLDIDEGPVIMENRMERVQDKLAIIEANRNVRLQEKQVIGKVLDQTADPETINVSCKKVTFRWQRGFKIGEGQCGTTVYSCINIDTGQTLAMKAMRFMRNDHSIIKDIADEIKNFEGIKHPNLVRYYGVEIHRDELLVFMEYCDEGTIAEAAKQGLPEHLIRRYTYEITVAINSLHEHGIVHRDIKGANIFLSSDGHVKLGDFGSSIKLKTQSTMPFEVNTFMGTAAYMAPEVITQAGKGGYGRAADIWSLGCVVIEMATGKGPWHEYDHNFTIIYKVGEGATPTIPESLSSEGIEFVNHCLQHDLTARWTASQLLDDPFLKVSQDGED
ncbi:mitogen-activated protein kinase kinase kinase 4-like [Glandiceps talaboti]